TANHQSPAADDLNAGLRHCGCIGHGGLWARCRRSVGRLRHHGAHLGHGECRIHASPTRRASSVMRRDSEAAHGYGVLAGLMLALRWNTLSGSYSALMRERRSYLAGPYEARMRSSSASLRKLTYVPIPDANGWRASYIVRTHARSALSRSAVGAMAAMLKTHLTKRLPPPAGASAL